MKEFFSILEHRERRIIVLLCLLLVLPLVFYVFVARGERNDYIRSLETLSAHKANFELLTGERNRKEEEWLRWEEAKQDIAEIRENYYYKDNDVFEKIRGDLRDIFRQAAIRVSRLKYDYAEMRRENVKKVIVNFELRGAYASLKKFMDLVERYPRFLIIEKIDFINIESESGLLELRITVAGYYES